MSLSLNLCFCIDLVLTLIDPFYPGKRRMNYYLSFSFIFCIIITFSFNGRLSCKPRPITFIEYCFEQSGMPQTQNKKTMIFLPLYLSLYIIVAVYSCVFAFRRLTRPGINKEVRFIFLFKHIAYTLVFIIIWTIFYVSSFYHIFGLKYVLGDDEE